MPRTREDLHTMICAREACGKQFFQRKAGQVFCSQACSNKEFPGIGGKKPTAGLAPRACANPSCGEVFQPYRDSQIACSRKCYNQLPEVRERMNSARRTPEFRKRKNQWRRESPAQQKRMYEYNRDRQFREKYGITVAEYEARLEAQGGVCMICGRPPKEDGTRAAASLHMDHDHLTGKNRDLLCGSCNSALGLLGDNPELLRKAAGYIERHRLAAVP